MSTSPLKKQVRVSVACSPIKQAAIQCCKVDKELSEENSSTDKELSEEDSSSDEEWVESDFSEFDCEIHDDETIKKRMKEEIVQIIEKYPKMYLGIPKCMFYVCEIFSSTLNLPLLHIVYITLVKIKLNWTYEILGTQFGLSSSSICRVVQNSLPKLADGCQELIIWSESQKLRSIMPISFRRRYSRVTSIIDCLEIEIEKPSDQVHQGLTWSAYKGCNTLKYLISCTPDGIINFISRGYGGRASDSAITEDCGYLNHLKPGMWIMADRGFKNLSCTLQQLGVHLVRPPTVSKNKKSTKLEVMQSKRIAALRIHVERVISRIRDFNLVKMHSVVDHNLAPNMDSVMVIAAGLTNLQRTLTKI